MHEVEKTKVEAMLYFQQNFSAYDVLIARMDRAFNFIEVNNQYALAANREPSYFPGKNHFALYPDKKIQTIFCTVVESGQPYRAWSKPFIYSQVPGTNNSYWDWFLRPVKNYDELTTGVVLYLMNATDRVQAENEKSELDDRYKWIFDVSEIGMAVFTPEDSSADFICIDVNEASARIKKVKRNEAIGKSVLEIFPSAKANGFFATLQNVLEFEKPVEHSASKYNNGWVSGWLKNYVYKLPSGEIAVLFLDVTKHKEAEFELRRAYEDLELKIAAKLSKQEAMDEGLAIQI